MLQAASKISGGRNTKNSAGPNAKGGRTCQMDPNAAPTATRSTAAGIRTRSAMIETSTAKASSATNAVTPEEIWSDTVPGFARKENLPAYAGSTLRFVTAHPLPGQGARYNRRMTTRASFLTAVFDRPMRKAVSALWFVGVGFATSAAVLTVMHPGLAPFAVFVVPAAALLLLAGGLLRSRMWAMGVSFVLLAGQIVGVVGTTFELVYGIDATKSAELRALGFDPRLGVAINLAFSIVGACVFAVALLRARRRVRARTAPRSADRHRRETGGKR